MDSSIPSLPKEDGLNIAALAGLFRHTTNSYKYLFFQSFLNLLKQSHFNSDIPLSYDSITVEMLSIAWYPHSFFRLSFGTQDTIGKKLDELAKGAVMDANIYLNRPTALRQTLAKADLRSARRLMDFVPYRLLIPFLNSTLMEVDKASWMVFEKALPSIANANFQIMKPLYCFNSGIYETCSEIRCHPEWASYLARHHAILEGWTAWHFLNYMQRRNPSTPALSRKLFPPTKRSSLHAQSQFWRSMINFADDRGEPMRCIYSGRQLNANDFVLDHYLPWSFVVHDQLWNLLPTFADANSSKSNMLPDKSYFLSFIQLHHAAIKYAEKTMMPSEFRKVTEDYVCDLAISLDDLLHFEHLKAAYERNLTPLATLASSQGFPSNWRFTSEIC